MHVAPHTHQPKQSPFAHLDGFWLFLFSVRCVLCDIVVVLIFVVACAFLMLFAAIGRFFFFFLVVVTARAATQQKPNKNVQKKKSPHAKLRFVETVE
jgi:hypothetical protein